MSEGGQQQARRTKAKMEKVLGEYSILAELARGGMGRVYVARRHGQAGFERYFAIKVMHQQLNDDQKWVMMLLDEAHIASKLHHPNVVPVLDIGTFAEGYYLVMDYVEGCSFQELLKKSPEHRPVKAVVSIMLDSLRGLHAVHTLRGENDEELHVVHRDVSPHNLLLGVDGSCRVTDFGIAKAKQRFTDTDVGTHKGKLAFMAPEQMRGQPNLDCRVDVWAAGVTLYKALTGVHPFRGENDAATIHAVIGGEIPVPSTVGLKPPAVFDEVIMRSLQRDPNQRYASAEQFADELRHAALQINALGSSSDVAQWVKATCGAQLAERRRKLANIPKNTEDTITGGTSSLPKLWFNQEGGQTSAGSGATNSATSASSPQITVDEAGWRAAGSSFAALASSRPRTFTIAAVLGIAAVVAVTVFFTRMQVEPPPQATGVQAPPQQPPSLPTVTPPPAPSREQPLSPTPALEPPAEPKRAAVPPDSGARRATPPRINAGKPHRSPAPAAAAPPAPRNEPPPVVEHAPPPAPAAPPPPAPASPGLDRNPYQLGE